MKADTLLKRGLRMAFFIRFFRGWFPGVRVALPPKNTGVWVNPAARKASQLLRAE